MTQPFIWCDNCEGVQPLLEDKMYGNDADGKGYINPTDLMCGKCHLVIATTWDASWATIEGTREQPTGTLPEPSSAARDGTQEKK